MNLKNCIREIENYPKEGISFKDLTTLFKSKDAFNYTVESIYSFFENHHIDKVVSLESRGFIVGGALAYKLNAGFIPVRKFGKLPGNRITQEYELEYGVDSVEIHSDAISEGDIILIHDDLIATGGTAYAAYELVKKLKPCKIYFSFICDLTFLNSEEKNKLRMQGYHSLVQY